MERMSWWESPPGRSVRPTEPAKRVSPARRRIRRGVEADAALGVAGGVEDRRGDAADRDASIVGEVCVGGRTSGVARPSQAAWTSIMATSGRSRWL